MKRTICLIIFVCLIFAIPCRSELKIDFGKKPTQIYDILKPKLRHIIVPDEQQCGVNFFELYPVFYINGETKISNLYPAFYIDEVNSFPELKDTFYSWNLNGKIYLSAIGVAYSHINKEYLPHDCVEVPDDTICQKEYASFSSYVLVMFNEATLDLSTYKKLYVKRPRQLSEGVPYVNKVIAMSVANNIQDAMLITLGYHVESSPELGYQIDSSIEYKTTLLLRLSEENGKLKIEQDDSCLGNPNSIATIAEARKKLKQCKEKSAR